MLRALCLSLCLAGPAVAQSDAASMADRAAQALSRAAESLEAAESSRDRVAALTRTVQAYEDGLSALRAGLRRAREDEARITARLDAERDQLGRLLGALQVMGGAPEVSLLLHPEGPVNTARAGILMADLTPALAARLEALTTDLRNIASLRAVQQSAEADLSDGLSQIQTARAALSKAVADRVDRPDRVAEDEAAMARLATDARSLRDFAANLPAGPAATEAADFLRAKGSLDLPVAGRVRLGFGDRDAAGITRPGWVIDTAPGALVTAPWPGTIRYRGPLLDYGNVMLLEPAEGYLLVLAGLDVVYGAPGQIVGADAPLGLMPSAQTAAPDEARDEAGAGQTAPQRLYVELRSDDGPVDPADWFTAQEE